jgi:hypothetical protein
MKFNLFILFCLVVFSCSSPDESYQIIDMSKNDAAISTIELNSYTSLESTDKAIIGEIRCFLYYKDHFYIFDKYKAKALFIYDKSGSLVYKTEHGKGPGEINELLGFYIDTLNNKEDYLLLFDYPKIIKRDLYGNYINEKVNLHEQLHKMIKVGKEQFFAFTQWPAQNEINEDKSKFNDLDRQTYTLINNPFSEEYLEYNNYFGFPIESEQNAVSLPKPMSVYNHEISCLVPLDNTIYSFRDKQMVPRYKVDFGKLTITNRDLEKGLIYVDPAIHEKLRAGRMNEIYESNQFVFFSYYYGHNKLHGVYSKKHKKTAVLNDLLKRDGLPDAKLIGIHGKQIICWVDSEEFKDFIMKNPQLAKENKYLSSTINPTLMFLTINEE